VSTRSSSHDPLGENWRTCHVLSGCASCDASNHSRGRPDRAVAESWSVPTTCGGFAWGDYRVIYGIDDTRRIIDIVAIRHRRDAYQ